MGDEIINVRDSLSINVTQTLPTNVKSTISVNPNDKKTTCEKSNFLVRTISNSMLLIISCHFHQLLLLLYKTLCGKRIHIVVIIQNEQFKINRYKKS